MLNKLTNVSGDERGMTGIGVLILFIALVLVAAIASGLILDTAGMLQNTAQDTGEQSTSEVSDRLSVLSSSGSVENVDVLNSVASTSNFDGSSSASVFTTDTISSGESFDSIELRGAEVVDTNDDGVDSTVTFTIDDGNNTVQVQTDEAITAGENENIALELSDSQVSSLDTGTTYDITINAINSGDALEADEIIAHTVTGQENRVSELSMTVYRSPGAGDVDLQQATIEYFGPAGTAFLIHDQEYQAVQDEGREDEFADNLGSFTTEAVKDGDGSIPVLNTRDDRAAMNVNFYDYPENVGQPDALNYLGPGESATLRLTTQQGATTTQIVNVPESLAGYDGSTVML